MMVAMTLAFVGVPYIYRKIIEKFKPVGRDQDTDDDATFGLSDAAFGVAANLTNQSGIFTILSVKFELSRMGSDLFDTGGPPPLER